MSETMDLVDKQRSEIPTGVETTRSGPEASLSPQLQAMSSPGGMVAETIGALRTHILAQHMRDGRRSLTICGPSAGVGASFIAANLAVSTAQAGVKTLLIDANMRAPGQDDYFQSRQKAPGLLQCLTDLRLPLGDAVRAEVIPNLSVMPAGGIASNPQALLAGPDFKGVIDRCLRDFDLTLVDCPPANSCADALRVASVLRYALVVVRHNISFVSDVQQLLKDLRTDRIEVIGTFLNTY
jgi:protein-tyrosine kinase